jgi:DNA helicase-2/ATP-dependent DNA helicase PcrA
MHAAKGLEWDAVFIAGLSEGLMPISLAETDDALEEERRLLYVAVTRAREHLALSFARSRNEGGRASRKRTRFLEKWWPDARPPRQQRVSASAADLTATELELFERLKAWRLEHAKASDRPAFTVLVDSSLAAIARERPATLRELGAIHGIGASKLEVYGAEILSLVAAAPAAPQPQSG